MSYTQEELAIIRKANAIRAQRETDARRIRFGKKAVLVPGWGRVFPNRFRKSHQLSLKLERFVSDEEAETMEDP